MRFGIILCKICRRALGVDLRFKSTTCPFCNKKIKFSMVDIKYKTDSEKDLALRISKVNVQIVEEVEFNIDAKTENQKRSIKDWSSKRDVEKVEPQIYENLDPFKRIALKYKNQNQSMLLAEKLIIALGQELGEITLENFQRLLIECNIDQNKAYEYLEQLKNHGIIFEPKVGVYKVIGDN